MKLSYLTLRVMYMSFFFFGNGGEGCNVSPSNLKIEFEIMIISIILDL